MDWQTQCFVNLHDIEYSIEQKKVSGDMWGNLDYIQYSAIYILLLNKWHTEHSYIMDNITNNNKNVLLHCYGLVTGMNIIKHNLQ